MNWCEPDTQAFLNKWHSGQQEKMIQEKYLENCLRQKDSEYKDLKSYQPVRASVVELIEVKLNMEVGDWWKKSLTVI